MDKLPYELVMLIASHLSADDIKALRLIHRNIANILADRLFAHLTINGPTPLGRPKSADFSTLDDAVRELDQVLDCVTHLTFSPAYYAEDWVECEMDMHHCTDRSLAETFKFSKKESSKDSTAYIEERLMLAHWKARCEDQVVMKDASERAVLTMARKLTQLTSLTIRPWRFQGFAFNDPSYRIKFDSFGIEACARVEQLKRQSKYVMGFIKLWSFALQHHQQHIKELTLNWMSLKDFELPLQGLHMFRHLVVLHLHFGKACKKSQLACESTEGVPYIYLALRETGETLEKLTLSFDPSGTADRYPHPDTSEVSSLDIFFGDDDLDPLIYFPRLKSFVLDTICTDLDSLLYLLRRLKGLKEFQTKNTYLFDHYTEDDLSWPNDVVPFIPQNIETWKVRNVGILEKTFNSKMWQVREFARLQKDWDVFAYPEDERSKWSAVLKRV